MLYKAKTVKLIQFENLCVFQVKQLEKMGEGALFSKLVVFGDVDSGLKTCNLNQLSRTSAPNR